MEKHFCEECEKEIPKDHYKLISKRKEKDWGMLIPRDIGEFCSDKCVAEWVNNKRRSVTEITTIEGTSTVTIYSNPELEQDINPDQLQIEKGKLCIKPEVWDDLIGN